MKPKYQDIVFTLCLNIAKRSTCKRLKVGCVITSPNYRRIYGIGYNGRATGLDNKCIIDKVTGKCGQNHIHAEQNCIINSTASYNDKKIVFISHACCEMCAMMLVNLGNVKIVYYLNDFRCKKGLNILKKARIKVIKWKYKKL